MDIDKAKVVKIGIVRRRNRIPIGDLMHDAKKVALRLKDGFVYIERADDILTLSKQPDRIHLGDAAEYLGLREGDKFVIIENDGEYVLLKLNVALEEVKCLADTTIEGNLQKKQ